MQIIDDNYDLAPQDAKEGYDDARVTAGEPEERSETSMDSNQSHALRQLKSLRAKLPVHDAQDHKGRGGGRRDYRRWLTPDLVTVELYDDAVWHPVETLDCGIPGVRVIGLPAFVGNGPAVVRLTTPTCSVLVLGNVMWSDKRAGTAGLYFEFNSDHDREAWFEGLVEALLSSHALY